MQYVEEHIYHTTYCVRRENTKMYIYVRKINQKPMNLVIHKGQGGK